MSAFYSFVYRDKVQLLTDGGFFDESGILRAVGRKVFAFEDLPLAVTGRGSSTDRVFEVIGDIMAIVSGMSPFDDADPVLSIIGRYFTSLRNRYGTFDAEFLIAAYSKTQGPCHFVVACHEHWGVKSFELLSPGSQIGAGPQIDLGDIAHLNLSSDEISSPDFPERWGIEVLEAMRGKLASVPGMEREFYGVGGQCDLTTVSADGVRITTLGRWDDEVGQPVDPRRRILWRKEP